MKSEKKEKHAEFHRERIVDAAEKLFLQNGVDKTVMDEIAREAGYSKATVYVYFASKGEIFDYVILRGMELFTNRLRETAGTDKPLKDKFTDVCFAHFRFAEEYPLYYEALLGKISVETEAEKTDGIRGRIYRKGEELNGFLAGFLTEGIQNGTLRNGLPAFETIFTLWACISGVVKIAAQKTRYIEESTHKTCDEFLRYGFSLLYDSIKA